MKHVLLITILVGSFFLSFSQNFDPGDIPADSWEKTLRNGKGTISALWYDINPFIYRNGKGIAGVEYEIMESFVSYLRKKYKIELTVNWVDAKSFENIYPYIAKTKKSAVFGWSYFSITDERKKEVKFTPAYMPDVNIIVTDASQPLYESNEAFIKNLNGKTAYTMATTMMEQDIYTIRNNFYKGLKVNNEFDDYAVMEKISENTNSFGYVPLSIYVMGLQKGIKVKRQVVLTSRREGFAGIYPKASDWDEPVNEYFNSPAFASFSAGIVKKYLGSQVTDLIFKASLPDSLRTAQNDNEMLTLEKEIVSKTLVASALQMQQDKVIQNSVIAGITIAVLIIVILYGRYKVKQKFVKLLQQRNEIILKQKEEIEVINKKLETKVLLAQMNPHLVFNSMNAIQYFVTMDDKKNALGYITAFSRHLRLILSNASSLTISVDKEIKMLQQYLELEQIRFQYKFTYALLPPKEPSALLVEIPSMLIYPFAELALYQHVLTNDSGKGFIKITFEKVESDMKVVIEYNSNVKNFEPGTMDKLNNTAGSEAFKLVLSHIELLNYNKARKIAVQSVVLENIFTTILIPGVF